MQAKKFLCVLFVCAVLACCLGVDAGAVQAPDLEQSIAINRASGRFSMDVYAQEVVAAESSFPLEVGETVTHIETVRN